MYWYILFFLLNFKLERMTNYDSKSIISKYLDAIFSNSKFVEQDTVVTYLYKDIRIYLLKSAFNI